MKIGVDIMSYVLCFLLIVFTAIGGAIAKHVLHLGIVSGIVGIAFGITCYILLAMYICSKLRRGRKSNKDE